MKKSTTSIVVLVIIMILLLCTYEGGGLLGIGFLLVTTGEVNTIIKNKGKVNVTFWGVKPIQ